MDPLPSCSPYLPSYLPPPCLKLLSFHFPTMPYLYTLTADVLYHKNPPNCTPILPCPLPYHFAFLDHLWSSPCYQHPPLPLHIHLHCLSGLSTPCLIHPIPLPLPAPLPPFSLFLADLWMFFACIFILSYPILSIHVHT